MAGETANKAQSVTISQYRLFNVAIRNASPKFRPADPSNVVSDPKSCNRNSGVLLEH